MNMTAKLLASLALLTSVASAQPAEPVAPGDDTGTPAADAPPTPTGNLPPPQSDNDPAPPVAAVAVPPGGLVEQAGVGGVVGYGRAGVLEVGGTAGLVFASDYRNISIAPSIGWFFADNLQLSVIASVGNVKSGGSSSTLVSGFVEPSYHLPFNRTTFGFLGLGVGASHVSAFGTGFAIAPRLGANFLIGRSGILTPSISYEYTTVDTDAGNGTVTVVAVTSALKVNLGFTVMW